MNIVLKDLEIKDWKQIKKVAESSWNFTYGKILSQETIDKYIKSNYSREATQQAIEWAKKITVNISLQKLTIRLLDLQLSDLIKTDGDYGGYIYHLSILEKVLV